MTENEGYIHRLVQEYPDCFIYRWSELHVIEDDGLSIPCILRYFEPMDLIHDYNWLEKLDSGKCSLSFNEQNLLYMPRDSVEKTMKIDFASYEDLKEHTLKIYTKWMEVRKKLIKKRRLEKIEEL